MDKKYYDEELKKIKVMLSKDKIPLNYETLFRLYKKIFFMERNNNINYDFCNLCVTKKVVLDFFKSVSDDFYIKAKKILDDKKETRIFDANLIGDKTIDEDGYLMYENASVITNFKKKEKRIYLPYLENTSDIYTFVHEIAHTFDLRDFYTYKRDVLSEITPFVFEGLLDNYLISKKLDHIVDSHKKARIKDTVTTSANYIMISFLANVMYKEKDLDYETLKNSMLKEKEIFDYVTEENIDIFMKRVLEESTPEKIENFIYASRYLISTIAAAHFLEEYNLENLEKYIKTIGYVEVNQSLSFLGLRFDERGRCVNENEVLKTFNKNFNQVNSDRALTKKL